MESLTAKSTDQNKRVHDKIRTRCFEVCRPIRFVRESPKTTISRVIQLMRSRDTSSAITICAAACSAGHHESYRQKIAEFTPLRETQAVTSHSKQDQP